MGVGQASEGCVILTGAFVFVFRSVLCQGRGPGRGAREGVVGVVWRVLL